MKTALITITLALPFTVSITLLIVSLVQRRRRRQLPDNLILPPAFFQGSTGTQAEMAEKIREQLKKKP